MTDRLEAKVSSSLLVSAGLAKSVALPVKIHPGLCVFSVAADEPYPGGGLRGRHPGLQAHHEGREARGPGGGGRHARVSALLRSDQTQQISDPSVCVSYRPIRFLGYSIYNKSDKRNLLKGLSFRTD